MRSYLLEDNEEFLTVLPFTAFLNILNLCVSQFVHIGIQFTGSHGGSLIFIANQHTVSAKLD